MIRYTFLLILLLSRHDIPDGIDAKAVSAEVRLSTADDSSLVFADDRTQCGVMTCNRHIVHVRCAICHISDKTVHGAGACRQSTLVALLDFSRDKCIR